MINKKYNFLTTTVRDMEYMRLKVDFFLHFLYFGAEFSLIAVETFMSEDLK